MKMTMVLTTINVPTLLDGYFTNFKKYGHLEDTQVVVIPDKKTPKEIFEYCDKLQKKGLKTVCPDIDAQNDYLKKLGLPENFIPCNSDNRRNIGYLMALESKCDFVVSIDDDNYCRDDEDYFLGHSIVCDHSASLDCIGSDSGWFNICSLMNCEPDQVTYARGYPYYARHKKDALQIETRVSDVHLNAGLWLMDPDVDGISWLVNPVHTTSFKGKSFGLGDNTWSPINTQNTGLRRDAMFAYYFVKMNYPLAGIPIDRYGDIFSGYFVQACTRVLKGDIRVGSPIADHKRNSHNYMNDAANEFACILVLEDLLPWLSEDAKLSGKTYAEVYESLSYSIEEAVEKFKGRIWTDATRGYFHQMAYCMRQWADTCYRIG